ncbi:MAG TPA: hypothetical protein VM819_14295 [Vicinamibacterales bacterium]|jgi:hypothetical protein|nr:hypothetical protein [Vicinamibacterales bacterium]
MHRILAVATIAGCLALTAPTTAQNKMSFFVTSVGSGNGGNLGGLNGADKQCQALAAKAGAGNRTWRAYLSTSGAGGVNARDRIGKGPWVNAKGQVIANNVDELHSDKVNINNDAALDEQGRPINAPGAPNRHDILTGSTPDGRATDTTCQNWTSAAGDQTAMLGHHDRMTFGKPGSPWNAAHASKGCSQENLVATGGAGLFYCFAAD